MLPTRSAKMSSELPTQEEIFYDDDLPFPDLRMAIIEERIKRFRTDGTFEEFEKEFEALCNEFEEEDLTEEEIIIDDDLPVPDWHLAISEERKALYASEDVTKWRTWEEVKRELLQMIFEEMKRRKI